MVRNKQNTGNIGQEDENNLEVLDLSSLLLGFSSAALGYLEEEKPTQTQLNLARQNIEIIDLLEVKTKHSQTAEEAQLFSDLRRDLRIRFAEAVQKLGTSIKS